MELVGHRNGWRTMRTNQRIWKVGGGYRTVKSDATLRFTDVGYQFGGAYWKVHQLARFDLRPVEADGSYGEPVRTSPKLNYCLRDLYRTQPSAVSPPSRHYPACNQNPYRNRVTLGTSVGWSDIYPAPYHQQYINVSGLRGCFVYEMTVDPEGNLFESNEKDNTSQPSRPAALRRPGHELRADGRRLASRRRRRRGRWPGRPPETAPLRRICQEPSASIAVRSTTVEGNPVSSPPSIARSAPATIESGTSSKRDGAGSPLRLAEVWKIGHHRAAQGPVEQAHAESAEVLATGQRVAPLGVGDDQGQRSRQQSADRRFGARAEPGRPARASPAARST